MFSLMAPAAFTYGTYLASSDNNPFVILQLQYIECDLQWLCSFRVQHPFLNRKQPSAPLSVFHFFLYFSFFWDTHCTTLLVENLLSPAIQTALWNILRAMVD